MKIIPVLDIRGSIVVHGVGGRRAQYRPIRSTLTSSVQPLDVARAFRDHFGFDELYLADLDAIAGGPPALPVCAALLNESFRLWVDAGVGTRGSTIDELGEAGVQTTIAGLESLGGIEELNELLERHNPMHLVFSLDLKGGQSLAGATWRMRDPWSIAGQVIAAGVRRVLVLDLAAVGSGRVLTAEWCKRLRQSFPDLEISTGGGIRCADDVTRMQEIGVNCVLVASALHSGTALSARAKGSSI
jgi:phosphoribosylformimino-5-aminoimidazole carboxamide ribotide isomerase